MYERAELIDFGDVRLDSIQRAIRPVAIAQLLETGQPTPIETIASSAEIPHHFVGEVMQSFARAGFGPPRRMERVGEYRHQR